MERLITRLPTVRGRYRENADLSKSNWFQLGGPAEVLFKPEDASDLADFMRGKPQDVPVTLIGVGSNLIVRDGGIDGVVIRLGRGFTQCVAQGEHTESLQTGQVAGAQRGVWGASPNHNHIYTGAACLDINVAQVACEAGLAGLEFLSGVPGTIGGALAMNAGAYGAEIADILVEVEVVTAEGEIKRVSPEVFNYGYRHAEIPEGWIFTGCVLRGTPGDKAEIAARMRQIQTEREASQPIRSRTGGSTFRNPEGHKAWQLVDAAGCRGLRIGDAGISELHCNFMINHGNASAADLENLGEEVRRRVKAQSGIELHWEIKRIGKSA